MGKDEFSVKIHGEEERKQPVKSLWKLFDSSMKDTAAIQKSSEELGGWLSKMDKSGMPGRFKPALHAALNHVSSAGLCSPNTNCGIPGKEDQ